MSERVSSAAAGVATSSLERLGRGVWLITPAPSKARPRRMEATGQGDAGAERGARAASRPGMGSEPARSPLAEPRLSGWGPLPTLSGRARGLSDPGAAHSSDVGKCPCSAPLASLAAWPENLFCKVGRETEAPGGEGAPKVIRLAGRADRSEPPRGFLFPADDAAFVCWRRRPAFLRPASLLRHPGRIAALL